MGQALDTLVCALVVVVVVEVRPISVCTGGGGGADELDTLVCALAAVHVVFHVTDLVTLLSLPPPNNIPLPSLPVISPSPPSQ